MSIAFIVVIVVFGFPDPFIIVVYGFTPISLLSERYCIYAFHLSFLLKQSLFHLTSQPIPYISFMKSKNKEGWSFISLPHPILHDLREIKRILFHSLFHLFTPIKRYSRVI